MSLYPRQYHLAELTAHVIALLERRRAGLETWDEGAERLLLDEAKKALDEAGAQFKEVADDAAYWHRTAELLMTVAMPRYLKLAKEAQALEAAGYGAWRKGDFVSRAAYAAVGAVTGFIILRTAIPDWLEPIPLALFLGGPVLPDLQAWWARRRYRKALVQLVDDMQKEAEERRAYQPLGVSEPPGQQVEVQGEQQRAQKRRD